MGFLSIDWLAEGFVLEKYAVMQRDVVETKLPINGLKLIRLNQCSEIQF